MKTRPCHLLALAMALAMATTASAGELFDLLAERQARLDAALVVETAEMTPSERRGVSDILAELLDFEAMAEKALRKEWGGLDEAARAEFARRYERLVRAKLMETVDVYRSDAVEYLEEDVDAGRVLTSVARDDSLTDVEYKFRRDGDAWRIVDFAVDGSWITRQHWSEFRKDLKKYDWPTFLERVRERAVKIESEL